MRTRKAIEAGAEAVAAPEEAETVGVPGAEESEGAAFAREMEALAAAMEGGEGRPEEAASEAQETHETPRPQEAAKTAAPGREASGRGVDLMETLRRINASVERARRRALAGLERQRADIFSVVVELSIRDRIVWDAFLRSFVAVDACAVQLESDEISPVGRKKRAELAAELERMIEEFRAEQAKYLEAARELSARLLGGVEADELFVPVVEAPFKERIYVHSPAALKLVRALQDADAIVAELETLRWNGLRKAGEVNDERRRVQKEAARIGRFAARTGLLLERARRAVAKKPAALEAPPPA